MKTDPNPIPERNLVPSPQVPAVERRKKQVKASVPLSGIKAIGVSSLQDTLTCRRHSKDFTYARGDYLRSRIWVIGLIFLALTPIWIGVDLLMLPDSTLAYAMPGRLVMVAGLIITLLLTKHNRGNVLLTRLCAGLLLGLPAAFYALILIVTINNGSHNLIGYSFIPYMLTTMLSVFPFTLAESAIAGLTLIVLQLFSQHVTGTWMTAAGVQETWLLSALLVITMTANYFHLALLLRLYREATHDPLTGLLNRGALTHSLQQIAGARPQPTMSLLMIDIDHFKRINDEHGHSIGDLVLRQFASLLKQNVRGEDFVARYGGEEFVAVLVGANKNQALKVAEKIRRLAQNMQFKNHDNQPFQFTISIGVASYLDGDTFETVARRADDRLYIAKKTSRNCVVGA